MPTLLPTTSHAGLKPLVSTKPIIADEIFLNLVQILMPRKVRYPSTGTLIQGVEMIMELRHISNHHNMIVVEFLRGAFPFPLWKAVGGQGGFMEVFNGEESMFGDVTQIKHIQGYDSRTSAKPRTTNPWSLVRSFPLHTLRFPSGSLRFPELHAPKDLTKLRVVKMGLTHYTNFLLILLIPNLETLEVGLRLQSFMGLITQAREGPIKSLCPLTTLHLTLDVNHLPDSPTPIKPTAILASILRVIPTLQSVHIQIGQYDPETVWDVLTLLQTIRRGENLREVVMVLLNEGDEEDAKEMKELFEDRVSQMAKGEAQEWLERYLERLTLLDVSLRIVDGFEWAERVVWKLVQGEPVRRAKGRVNMPTTAFTDSAFASNFA